MNKETDLQIVKINSNGERGVIVVLQKVIPETKTLELAERTFVNLYTENNITYGKGSIMVRNYYLREIPVTNSETTNSDVNVEGNKHMTKTDGVLTKSEILKQKSKEQQPHKFQ